MTDFVNNKAVTVVGDSEFQFLIRVASRQGVGEARTKAESDIPR